METAQCWCGQRKPASLISRAPVLFPDFYCLHQWPRTSARATDMRAPLKYGTANYTQIPEFFDDGFFRTNKHKMLGGGKKVLKNVNNMLNTTLPAGWLKIIPFSCLSQVHLLETAEPGDPEAICSLSLLSGRYLFDFSFPLFFGWMTISRDGKIWHCLSFALLFHLLS